ncbi:MAG: alpha/beta fold hydrolase [Desertimonas sp.]
MPTETLRITVAPDVALAVDRSGDPGGRPVVLLHGGGQTRHSWNHTAAQLADAGWLVHNVDLRGHGDSDWAPDGDYSFPRFAEDVATLATTLERPPALVGASLGGIASLLAVGDGRRDQPVASALVLVDVAPKTEPAGVERIRTFMRSGLGGFADLDEAADAIQSYNPHRPRPKDVSGLKKNLRLRDDGRWYWHWDPRFMAPEEPDDHPSIDGIPQRRGIPQDELEAAARRVQIPTLLVRGGSSDLLSEEGARHLLGLIPHARLVDVAGAGHMVAGDRNDRFNQAVVDFLAAV